MLGGSLAQQVAWTRHPSLQMRKLTQGWLHDSHCLGGLGASFPTPSCTVSYHPGSKDGSSSSHAGVTSAAGLVWGEMWTWGQEGRGWGLTWTGQSRPGSSPSPRPTRRGRGGEPDVASGLDPQVLSPAGVLVSCTSQIKHGRVLGNRATRNNT